MAIRNNYEKLGGNTTENFQGVFSIQAALKTPNYGNYDASNILAQYVENSNSTDQLQTTDKLQTTDMAESQPQSTCMGGNCSSCPSKYSGNLKRFYEGVL